MEAAIAVSLLVFSSCAGLALIIAAVALMNKWEK